MAARTLFDKIWDSHVIASTEEGDVLHVDRHYLHDLGGAPALKALAARGLTVRAPDLTVAIPDHTVATGPGRVSPIPHIVLRLVDDLQARCQAAGIRYIAADDDAHGIVHVIAPEQGLTLPDMIVVCCDSHTCTHGALGAIGFGIGSSEVEHVLATQAIVQRKPRQLRVRLHGRRRPGVTAKDVALHLVSVIGAAGGSGHAVEYAGEAVAAMDIEERMTLCNLSIEFGAKIGLIAPDDTTFAWLAGRRHAPRGERLQQALAAWRTLRSDADAVFDRELDLDLGALAPQITWGTSPQDAMDVAGVAPDPRGYADPARQRAAAAGQAYLGVTPGAPLAGLAVDRVFIGSCANGRLDDLRAAAAQVRGRRVADHVTAWVVPGSQAVKRQAEAEGLARVFTDAGFDWREPGCSMCLAANGELAEPGQRVVATSNRNFVGRQGRDVRTHLASPATAAACAIAGVIAAPLP
ncbi:3-isopropylmalate dehydratase large subunit [Bordetella bronchiseptica]